MYLVSTVSLFEIHQKSKLILSKTDFGKLFHFYLISFGFPELLKTTKNFQCCPLKCTN